MSLPLILMIDGNVGPFHPDLLAAWGAAGIGAPCARCGSKLEEMGWGFGPICPSCERERYVTLGCECGGLNLCPDCQKAGATEATRGDVKCEPDCSSLCPVCSPDD